MNMLLTTPSRERIEKFRGIKLFKSLTDTEIESIAPRFHETRMDKESVIFY